MKRLLPFFLLVAILLSRADALNDMEQVYASEHFVYYLPSGSALRVSDWAEVCEAALRDLSANAPLAFAGRASIQVLLCPDSATFQQNTEMPPEHTLAVAVLSHRRILLNVSRLGSLSRLDQFQTLGHELVHLALHEIAVRHRTRAPFWLHEGLAQAVSGQVEHNLFFTLSLATLMERYIPMEKLTSFFPYQLDSAPLAYAQSLAFTRFVATEAYAFEDATHLFDALARNPVQAPKILADLNDATLVRRLDARWRLSRRKWLPWIVVLGSQGVLWPMMGLLFLVAYIRKKRREKTVIEQWEPWEQE